MKVILLDLEPADMILGVRAAKWLMDRFKKDAIISYGDAPNTIDIYVRRNKNSITARKCNWQANTSTALPQSKQT